MLSYAHRLDEHLETFGFPAKLTMKPSEVIQRQVYVSVEEAEPGLSVLLDTYPDNVIFASDYPHGDGIFPGSTEELAKTNDLTEEQRRAIFWTNAHTLYGLHDAHATKDQ